MRSVILSDKQSIIGVYAFRLCSSLEFIDIPNSVTTISKDAFSDCSNLESITLPVSIKYIKDDAFKFCRNLQIDINLPSLCELGARSFMESKIKMISNLGSITIIPLNCFRQCVDLTNVVLPETLTSIDEAAFGWCYSLKSVNIPDSLTTIGKDAFVNCYKLRSIVLSTSITSIGNFAFRNDSQLQLIRCESIAPPTLGSNVFDNTNNCPIYVPATSVSAYKSATNWSNYASRIQAIN